MTTAFQKNYTGKRAIDILKRRLLVDGFPIVVDTTKSRGAYLYNQVDGEKYFDFFSFFASLPLGFNHPGLKNKAYQKALQEAAQVKVSLSDIYSPHFARFVDVFDKITIRNQFRYLFFVEGGTLAVENGLKVAFDWKTRLNLKRGKNIEANQILHFKQCFHGRSGYTMSLTDSPDPRKTQYFPKFPWPRISNPKINVYEEENVPATIEAREKEAVQQMESLFAQFRDQIAAIIIEPIQGEGGGNQFRKEFFQKLRTLSDKNDCLLIFDEVQTGMGMTGKWWCWEHYGVRPDIMVFGKKLQVCGIAVTDRIDEEKIEHCFKISSRINSTFGGNLVDMVRATRYIEIIKEENLLANITQRSKEIMKAFQNLSHSYPLTNLRGLGGMIAVDVPTDKLRDEIVRAARQKERLLILPSGKRSLRLRPTLSLTKKEMEEGLGRLEKTLHRVFLSLRGTK
ncbi:MAG: L-lysine 6-transaminase [Deltaproteobacteria bacterium]|nr:L-lysine 6-transaminase [Deltaproteobacteria bacterium]